MGARFFADWEREVVRLGRAFSPHGVCGRLPGALPAGWDGVAPLARKSRAQGPPDTSVGQRPTIDREKTERQRRGPWRRVKRASGGAPEQKLAARMTVPQKRSGDGVAEPCLGTTRVSEVFARKRAVKEDAPRCGE